MEKLQNNTASKELIGGKTLHLITVETDIEISPESLAMGRAELLSDFMFGELSVDDTLTINGKNVIDILPQPDRFGNNRLALMAIIDSLPDDIKMQLVEPGDSTN